MAAEMMLHVSDLKNLQRCHQLAWLVRNHKLPYEAHLHLIAPFSTLWSAFLHLDDIPSTHVGGTNEESLALLEEHGALKNARLSWRGLRVRIPALLKRRDGQGYTAFYPFMAPYPKESEAWMMKINALVAERNGIDITENYALFFNQDYVRQDALDISSLFILSENLFNRKNRCNRSIAAAMAALDLDLDAIIDTAREALSVQPEYGRSKACLGAKKCPYYAMCFDDSALEEDSTLFLTTSRHKIDAWNQGICRCKDMPADMLEGSALQYAQIQASINGGCFADLYGIHNWLEQVEYPISYLDFEWDTFAVPPYSGMGCMDVLCFQYSLHVEQADGTLSHRDFFGQDDCRQDFIESLLENLPESGTILVYNMEGAEKLRLKQLAKQFPAYKSQLDAVCARMLDLSKPFEQGLFYHNAQRGHFSLKSLLPVFAHESGYDQLEVKNGLNAIQAYRSLETDPQQAESHIQSLLEYCAMDTYAEYIVYHGLCDLLKG